MDDKKLVPQKVWEGSIPVCLRLASDEASSEVTLALPPFFLLVPRVTYFPLVLEKIIRKMRTTTMTASRSSTELASASPSAQAVDEERYESNYWLSSHNDTPLKWHYPVGLLFDLYAGPSAKLPWEIAIHFNAYPSDILLAPPVSLKAIEAVFQATLKEADQLKHRGRRGPGPVFPRLLPHQTMQLWTGLLQHKFEQFWSVNQRFMQGAPLVEMQHQQQQQPSAVAKENDDGEDNDEAGDGGISNTGYAGGNADDADDAPRETPVSAEDPASVMVATGAMRAFRHCPLRLYFSTVAYCEVAEQDGVTVAYLQCLIPPFHEVHRTPNTLGDAVDLLFMSRAALKSSLRKEDYIFVLHGVETPIETPIQWMCENMAYPDNFVHVVARRKNSPEVQ